MLNYNIEKKVKIRKMLIEVTTSGFEDETAHIAVIVHQEIGSWLHTDVVGIALSDDYVPGGSVPFI